MPKSLIHNENYRSYKIEVYKLSTGSNHFQFSCYNPDGENVDHLKNSDVPTTLYSKQFALDDATQFIDRLIRDNQKN